MLKKAKLVKKNAAVSIKTAPNGNLSTELAEKRENSIMLQKALQFTEEWVARRQMEKANAREAFAGLFIKSVLKSI